MFTAIQYVLWEFIFMSEFRTAFLDIYVVRFHNQWRNILDTLFNGTRSDMWKTADKTISRYNVERNHFSGAFVIVYILKFLYSEKLIKFYVGWLQSCLVGKHY